MCFTDFRILPLALPLHAVTLGYLWIWNVSLTFFFTYWHINVRWLVNTLAHVNQQSLWIFITRGYRMKPIVLWGRLCRIYHEPRQWHKMLWVINTLEWSQPSHSMLLSNKASVHHTRLGYWSYFPRWHEQEHTDPTLMCVLKRDLLQCKSSSIICKEKEHNERSILCHWLISSLWSVKNINALL